jgi:hypothetical protein
MTPGAVVSFSRIVQKETHPANPAWTGNLVWSRAWRFPVKGLSHGLLLTQCRSSGPVLKEDLMVDNLEKETTAPLR